MNNIWRHFGGSIGYKVISAISSIVTVRVLIQLLGNEQYGNWVTLFGIVGWISTMDLGVGNGLRNELIKLEKNNPDYLGTISYAYRRFFLFTGLFSLVAVLLIGVLHKIYRIEFVSSAAIQVLSVSAIFCLLGKLVHSIKMSERNYSYVDMFLALNSLIILSVILFLRSINDNISIDGVALVYAIVPLSILLFQNLQFYRSMKKFSGWSSVNKNRAVFKVGLSFFLIQIAVLILNSTDNLMINAWFGASAVTDYYVTMRLTGYLLLFWSIISNMFWTEFGLLYNDRKLSILKNRVVILVKVSLVFIATVAFFILSFMEDILLVWIGEDITVSLVFKAVIILFIALSSVNSIYLALINGIGATRIQLFSSVATILLNIPLSYLYSVKLGMGPEGILLGTTTCLVYSFALRAWQVFNILQGSQRKLFYL